MRRLLWIALLLAVPSQVPATELKQSTAYNRTFIMVQSSDHISAATGATVTCTISKNAGAFGASGGSVSELSAGFYALALNTTDTNTIGDLAYSCTATNADSTQFVDQVTAAGAGGANVLLWNGTAVATPATAGIPDVNTKNWNNTVVGALQAFPANLSVFSIDANGRIDVSKVNGSALNALIAGRVDANAQVVGDKLNYNAANYRKNVAAQPAFPIYMRSSANTLLSMTGLSLTVQESKDTGALGAVTGTVTEVGSGLYAFTPSQADTNCDLCLFLVTGAGAVPYEFWIHTR